MYFDNLGEDGIIWVKGFPQNVSQSYEKPKINIRKK
jgi:hypothetical protein